jgi:predicted RNA-binding Zn-ribbon protein involved in translation (DUF1610 family)
MGFFSNAFSILRGIVRDRQLPMFGISRDGKIRSKCPSCHAPIELTIGPKGQQAFKCPACGEEAAWEKTP